MTDTPPTKRTEVRRLPERGVYDRDAIDAILDEALICHVALVYEGRPIVVPTIHARSGDTLYIHGSPASRMLRAMKGGAEICVTVALIDGLVVARTPFHNSMNYRSVVAYGVPRVVDDPDEKLAALEIVTEAVLPGRWADSRPPNEKEIKGTLIIAITLDEASAKVRTGDPGDEPEDYELPIWAGVIPMVTAYGEPINDPGLRMAVDAPEYVTNYRRPGR
jgi:nitroimidazol reductase NimA-like FMN-containing flavoprotein (pyridoxamine 5'-phosphate oxidase superfamily)